MAATVNFTMPFLQDLKDGKTEKSYYADSKAIGLVARRRKTGTISFAFRYRTGGQREVNLGPLGKITLDQARIKAKKLAGQVADNRDPAAEKSSPDGDGPTVNDVLDLFITAHVNHLRSAADIKSILRRQVRSKIGDKKIHGLQRSDIVEMLDTVAEDSGRTAADRTLAWVRKAFNWYTARDDKFVSPIVRGMRRVSDADGERKRFLNDQEIRDVWAALDAADVPDPYRRCIRLLMLSGQRRRDVAEAAWDDIDVEVWIVPGSRHKSKSDHLVPLIDAIREQLGQRRRGGYCFSLDEDRAIAINGFGKWKARLNIAIAKLRKEDKRSPMPKWQIKDLRRTHRTLMSRAGVDPDIAERVQGRKIAGARIHYDLWAYAPQKVEALQKVAELIHTILKGSDDTLAEPKGTIHIPGSRDDSKAKPARRRQKADLQHLSKALRAALARDLRNEKKLNSAARGRHPPDRPADVLDLRRPLEVLGKGEDEG